MLKKLVVMLGVVSLKSVTFDDESGGSKEAVVLRLEERYYKGKLAFRKWVYPGLGLATLSCVILRMIIGSMDEGLEAQTHTSNSDIIAKNPGGVFLASAFMLVGFGCVCYGVFSYWFQSLDF